MLDERAHRPDLDVSRIQLRAATDHWFLPIQKALHQKLQEKLLTELHNTQGLEHLKRFGLFLSQYRLPGNFLLELDRSELPLCFLSLGGNVDVRTWGEFENKPLKTSPEGFEYELTDLLMNFNNETKYEGFLNHWSGDDSLVDYTYDLYDIQLEQGISASHYLLKQFYTPEEVIFLEPPEDNLAPLVQEVWYPRQETQSRSVEEIAELVLKDPHTIPMHEQLKILVTANHRNIRFLKFPEGIYCPLRVGYGLFNIAHPVGELLLRAVAFRFLAKKRKTIVEADLGRLQDSMNTFFNPYPSRNKMDGAAQRLAAIAAGLGLSLIKWPQETAVDMEDFWYPPGSSPLRFLRNVKHRFGSSITA